LADWRVVYLRALRAPPTKANLAFLAKWQPWEGGATNNSARFNYFNTTQRMPGSRSINSVGVQSYGSLAQGAQAFAKTLLGMSNYSGLVNELRAGKGVGSGATAALSTWVSGQPASSQGLSYARKILGSAAHGGSFDVPDAVDAAVSTEAPRMGPGGPGIPLLAQIHSAAISSLQNIVRGETPTKSFGDFSQLVTTLRNTPTAPLKAAAAATPSPAPSSVPVSEQGHYGGEPSGQKAGHLDSRLTALAKKWGLTITSGYRSPAQNAAVGGAEHSYHMRGEAIDVAPNADAMKIYHYALAHPWLFTEAFYDPAGRYVKNGQVVKGKIGGHTDHVHLVLAA